MLSGFRTRTQDRRQTGNGPDGWSDQKGLAGPTIRLFMERDFYLAGDHGTPSEDEVPVRIGKDSRKHTWFAEGTMGQEVRLRSIVYLLCSGGEEANLNAKRILGCGTKDASWMHWAEVCSESFPILSVASALALGRAQENRFSNDAPHGSGKMARSSRFL